MSNLNSLNSSGDWAVEDGEAGERLDQVLARQVGTRSKAQRMIKGGLVTIDQVETLKVNYRVVTGEQISYDLPPSMPTKAVAVAHLLDIVFEDESLIVINKPRGMVVHPSAGHFDDTLVNYLLAHWGKDDAEGLRPGVVHRIDKDTSGLLVVTKTDKAQENLSDQFRDHSITRIYRALVWGEIEQPVGTINQPIGRHPKERLRFSVRSGGKRAVTHYKRLETFSKLSYVECRLETGRTHQIRVHLDHLRHSLVGDPLYGRYRDLSRILPKSLVDRLKAFRGQALHAMTLGFLHPETGEQLNFEVGLPPEFEELLGLLREVTGEG